MVIAVLFPVQDGRQYSAAQDGTACSPSKTLVRILNGFKISSTMAMLLQSSEVYTKSLGIRCSFSHNLDVLFC